MNLITVEQRRARLARRHHLAVQVDEPAQAVRSLVAVHSSDPGTVYLSMWARVRGFEVADLEDLLYEHRVLVRHWAMRRTLWVVDRSQLPSLVTSSTDPIGVKERRRTAKLLEDGGVTDDGESWLDAAIPPVLEAIRARGEVLTRQLSAALPDLTGKITFTNKAGKVMGTTGTISRVVLQLGMESRLVRGRPAGTWISGQYRWAVLDEWLGEPLQRTTLREASASLLGDYLRGFGPATETDLRWWTGWPARQVRDALADLDAVEVSLENGSGYLLGDDLEDVPLPDPWVALLPSLDSTSMGWKERDWYLGDYGDVLFDRNGNAGPTVWANGRIVGGWAQRRDGEVVFELFEDLDPELETAIDKERERLQAWLGDTRVPPRFRSPHDKALAP